MERSPHLARAVLGLAQQYPRWGKDMLKSPGGERVLKEMWSADSCYSMEEKELADHATGAVALKIRSILFRHQGNCDGPLLPGQGMQEGHQIGLLLLSEVQRLDLLGQVAQATDPSAEWCAILGAWN